VSFQVCSRIIEFLLQLKYYCTYYFKQFLKNVFF